ncbi:hypothetical protein K493DRAFT_348434 [Basidiobolus meristosporus CBS 931.73]|uniref:DUF606-domain-containing protein n=1 Tax=Basidiobolus meristosporus CBS 931.73 TaxID=1314790 RepID=A0A1Y1YNQ2_9FUNG|nr:hypothetical protein K493DRAFT_348434 [Basidiobolus meristosporus CBS 931.73]|eukprot:ORX99649.1 hypothetical protein K493DRAFT_348434 [Basidiobolus meristosporus CBS 931.73]
MGRIAGKTFSSVNSFITGLIPLFIVFLIESKGVTKTMVTAESVAHVPWWGWIGGMLGTIYVLSQIFVVPKIGAANFTGVLVSTQLTTAVLMDNWGIVGVPQRSLTLYRGLGLAGLLISVFVITQSAGAPQTAPKEETVVDLEEKKTNISEA